MTTAHAPRSRHGHTLARALVAVMLVLPVAALGHTPAFAALPDGASQYVPLTPVRIVDTRPAQGNFGYTRIDANTLRVDITHRAGVPADATAAVVNITVIGSSGAGNVVAFPTGAAVPTSSSVNTDGPGRVVANMVHVKVGTGGTIDLRFSRSAHVAVDLIGVYVPATGPVTSGRLVTLATGAKRVLDTRDRGYPAPANSVTHVDLTASGVPVAVAAVVLTITAVQGQPGHWTAYTGGAARPAVSTLNLDTPGQTRANQAIVAMNGTNRTIDVYSLAGGHLLVDVVGWFTGATASADAAGLFVPTSPIRMLDTRILRTLAPWARSTYEFTTANPTAQVSAVALNVTALNAWDPGFVTALPAGLPVPGASNLNLTGWQQVTAAHAIVAVSTRGAALYTSAGAHLVADVAGWYLGTPTTPTRAPQANPTFNPNPVNSVYVPSLGVFVGTRSGPDPDAIVDQGYAAVTGSLLNVANVGNVMLFAHRTSGTAPFRYLNQLQVGGEFSLVGADGHWYHYKVVRTAVTTPDYSSIAGQAAGQGSVTAQLIACSRSNGTPGGTSYRIVVTGRLVSVS